MYQVVHLQLPFELEDEVVAALWEAGTLGVQIDEEGREALFMTAYFEDEAGVPVKEIIGSGLVARGVQVSSVESMEDRDWLARYRERTRPVAVGSRLEVDPREPDMMSEGETSTAPGSGRFKLRIPARTAFGTGTHASTRLVVDLMETLSLEGLRVLDLGAGTGILSFAALLFGAGHVTAIECDMQAALLAQENRRLNRLWPAIVAGRLSALVAKARFDVALVNVIPQNVDTDLSRLHELVRADGLTIFSGILVEESNRVSKRLSEQGFRVIASRRSAEWIGLLTQVISS